MKYNPQTIALRTRKLGLLILNARQVARRTEEECAQVLGVSTHAYQEIEKGQQAPTLPQLELLAYYLNVPLEQFYSNQALSTEKPGLAETTRVQTLRQKMIGTTLRMVRSAQNMSIQDLSLKSGLSIITLEKYEAGTDPIPLTELEVLAQVLETPIEKFTDQRGLVGSWRQQQELTRTFLDLPTELQEFICNPVNRPYLALAVKLSGLSVERLRTVAEGLLEITY